MLHFLKLCIFVFFLIWAVVEGKFVPEIYQQLLVSDKTESERKENCVGTVQTTLQTVQHIRQSSQEKEPITDGFRSSACTTSTCEDDLGEVYRLS